MEFSISSMINQIAVMGLPYLLAVTVPVIAQAYLADYMGDRGPRYDGRLTIDPLKHADPITTGLFPLLSVLLQSPILFGFPKQLNVNPASFNQKNGIIYFSLIGPISLIVMAIIFALIVKYTYNMTGGQGWLFEMSRGGLMICSFFAILRLFPIPPGDGAMVLAQFLPRDVAEKYWSIAPYGFFIFIGILMLAPKLFIVPANNLMFMIINLVGP